MPLLLELILLLLLREQLRWQLKWLRLLKGVLQLLRRWRQSQNDAFDGAGLGLARPANSATAAPAAGNLDGPSGLEPAQRPRRLRHRLPGLDRVDQPRASAAGPRVNDSPGAPLPARLAGWQPRCLHGGGAAGPARASEPRCASLRRQRPVAP